MALINFKLCDQLYSSTIADWRVKSTKSYTPSGSSRINLIINNNCLRERVLPKYVNFPTTVSLWSLIFILGSTYVFPGAGWCKTSIFLVLIVRPKLLQDCEKHFILLCMSGSDPEFSAQSSANKKSLSLSSDTLVLALRHWRLNSLPSVWYLMSMPGSLAQNVSVSMAENSRGKNTTLLDSIYNWKMLWRVTMKSLHGIVSPRIWIFQDS